MSLQAICLYAGGALTMLTGLGCALGAYMFLSGRAANWPEVIGSPPMLQRTGIGLAVISLLLIASAVGVLLQSRGAFVAAAAMLVVFVAGGFWGNYVVFGDFRPVHTVSNVFIAAIALMLLWFGYPPDVVVS